MTNAELLDFEFESSDIGQTTIRLYLHQLLLTLWVEGEGFSGKRPFGNSGWHLDLYRALVKAGAVEGSLDPDGWLENYDRDGADTKVRELIDEICDVEPIEEQE